MEALTKLYDAIRPQDGSMPDLGNIDVTAERVHPVLSGAVSDAALLEQAREEQLTPDQAEALLWFLEAALLPLGAYDPEKEQLLPFARTKLRSLASGAEREGGQQHG